MSPTLVNPTSPNQLSVQEEKKQSNVHHYGTAISRRQQQQQQHTPEIVQSQSLFYQSTQRSNSADWHQEMPEKANNPNNVGQSKPKHGSALCTSEYYQLLSKYLSQPLSNTENHLEPAPRANTSNDADATTAITAGVSRSEYSMLLSEYISQPPSRAKRHLENNFPAANNHRNSVATTAIGEAGRMHSYDKRLIPSPHSVIPHEKQRESATSNSTEYLHDRCASYTQYDGRVSTSLLETNFMSNKGESSKGESSKGEGLRQWTQYSPRQYRDHACHPPLPITKSSKAPRGGVSVRFPERLHNILTETTTEGCFEGIVSWQPHGRAFLVRDKKRFTQEVLPKYFKQSKFSSFCRQLSLYGFVRLRRDGPDKGGYYHEMFLRGRKDLCLRIIRLSKADNDEAKVYTPPDLEPKLYEMAPVHGLP